MKSASETVNNPFPPVCDEHSVVLILGSLPSVDSRAAGFYYMNPRNRFWKVMSALLKEDFIGMGKEEKTAALKSRGVALYDVVLSCEIHRSADASIKNVVYADVDSILERGKVKAIFLNGKKAYELFVRAFPQHKDIATCLPSTSPANASSSLDALVAEWGNALLPFLK